MKATTKEVRDLFNAEIAKRADKDEVARLELLREYFTNENFRAAMAEEVSTRS